ncbi:MAG TPA: LysR substrate-binding domain-containing protein, partial [Anaeromyxobacteraceae bacterium]|nr:LysR substrate-binding domain-containing protein [Anaeromyxobacteraceae bacterium]
RHPNLSVELVAATRALDLLRGDAELAVRLFRPREPGLVARRLGALRYGLYASRSYLEAAGPLRSPAELSAHAVLGFDAALESTPEMRWLARHVAPVRWAVRTSSTAVLLAACRAGVGIAPLAARFAASTPELLPVLPEAELPAREAWLVVHPDLRRSARIQATSAWIADALRGPGPERREAAPARRRSGHR